MSLKNFSAFSKINLMMHQTEMIQECLLIILSMRLVNVKLLKLSVNLRKVMCLAVKPVKVTLIMKTCTKTQSTNKPTHGNQGQGGNLFTQKLVLL